jgi:hypothetical protein
MIVNSLVNKIISIRMAFFLKFCRFLVLETIIFYRQKVLARRIYYQCKVRRMCISGD